VSTKHLLCQVSISLIVFIPVASWTEYLKNKLFCRNGTVDDILLGFKNLADYELNPPYFGAIVGRVANRIANGKFSIDGVDFQLECNENGRNHLHGGHCGFDKKFWNSTPSEDGHSVTFNLESPDGDQCYPGEIDASVCYTLNDDNELHISFKAIVKDKPTIINMTSHPYFNLSGTQKKCDDITDHLLEINANTYLPTKNQIPTGEKASVRENDGEFDFKRPKLLREALDNVSGNGYDHTFLKCHKSNYCARVQHPGSGRVLEIYSSQPGIHLYTPDFTCGSLVGKHGEAYSGRSGFCIENQNFPNSINMHFPPSPILRPGCLYEHFINLKFSVQ